MTPIIFTLVITMVVNGQDVERHETMPSRAACWETAQVRMEQILSSVHDGMSIRKVGVGCVADAGDPA